MSRLTAVDVVLRERESVAALPSAVRAIRQFADASVLAKLRRAVRTHATTAEMEQILREHSEDERLDALERSGEWMRVCEPKSATPEQTTLVNHVLVYGAKNGSVAVVEWALTAAPSVLVNGALRAAVNNGHAAIVRKLHPKVRAFGFGFGEDLLLDLAAARGHTDVLDWMYTHRRDPSASCTRAASESAAKGGHVEVLCWIRAHCQRQWSPSVLEQAALHDQQRVMDWVVDEQIQSRVSAVMVSVARRDKFSALVWLHDKYPSERLPLWMLKRMASTVQLELVSRLLVTLPGRYAQHGVVIGVLRGDLALVQTLIAERRHQKKELKYAMCLAARLGHIAIVQCLRCHAGGFLPAKALWHALRFSHVDVVAWILEQMPEMRTHSSLVEMRLVSLKQPKQTRMSRYTGDNEKLVQWIDRQLDHLAAQAS